VNQVDGFGRLKFPGLGSTRFDLFWQLRTASVALTCRLPGCTAHSSLVAPFDSKLEMHKDCKLTVKFHPTDFDDQYSGEMIEWVQLNSVQVQSGCHPLAHGCNNTMWRPLMTCVHAAPIDLVIPENGEIKISAKIPEVVDECPYQGNLLSGMATLSCLVSPKPSPPHIPVPALVVGQEEQKCVNNMPLQCATRGCSAEIVVPRCSTDYYMAAHKCTLSVVVNQTDYDNLDGTPELIEYIRVDGEQVATNLKPGLNPCKWTWHGFPYPASELTYSALTDYDVTEAVHRNGQVSIAGKISPYVDECANNGYLFDAMATLTCIS